MMLQGSYKEVILIHQNNADMSKCTDSTKIMKKAIEQKIILKLSQFRKCINLIKKTQIISRVMSDCKIKMGYK